MASPVENGFLPFSLPNFPSPTLRVGQKETEAQITLENANFNLQTNRKLLFDGNGQISAVGDLSFLTPGTPTVPALTVFANGNVGIGTGTRQPTDKLEIAGSLKLGTGLSINQFSGDITDNDQVVPTAKAVKTYVDEKLSPELPNGSVGELQLANSAVTTDKIADGAITTAKLNFIIPTASSQWKGKDGEPISYSGNVGIGTGTNIPQAKLQVANGAIMPSAGNSETAGIMFPKDAFGGAGDAAWIRYYARTAEATTFEIGTSNDAGDHIALMPSGNVGIGTNIPQAKLQVANGAIMPSAGNSEAAGIMFPKDAFGGAGDAAWIRYYALKGEATTLEIGTSNDADDHIALMPSGNVGIGTSRPSAKLHIYDPTDNQGLGGSIKFFDKGANWKYEVSYDGGYDGQFTFTNTGIREGETRFQSLATGLKLLTIKNTGEVSGRLVNTSSRELKENITDFSTQEAIEALANLNPVKFNYREDNQKQLKAGFIAEDVPELVATADRKGICALDIVAVLTKVIQQQQEELFCLKERLNAIEAMA